MIDDWWLPTDTEETASGHITEKKFDAGRLVTTKDVQNDMKWSQFRSKTCFPGLFWTGETTKMLSTGGSSGR